jgi:hypothetical protein
MAIFYPCRVIHFADIQNLFFFQAKKAYKDKRVNCCKRKLAKTVSWLDRGGWLHEQGNKPFCAVNVDIRQLCSAGIGV